MSGAPSRPVTILFNGDSTEVEHDCTVAVLVESLIGTPVEQRGVAVAVNREVVPRSAWGGRHLSEGDQVEVLSAAQGG